MDIYMCRYMRRQRSRQIETTHKSRWNDRQAYGHLGWNRSSHARLQKYSGVSHESLHSQLSTSSSSSDPKPSKLHVVQASPAELKLLKSVSNPAIQTPDFSCIQRHPCWTCSGLDRLETRASNVSSSAPETRQNEVWEDHGGCQVGVQKGTISR